MMTIGENRKFWKNWDGNWKSYPLGPPREIDAYLTYINSTYVNCEIKVKMKANCSQRLFRKLLFPYELIYIIDLPFGHSLIVSK